LKKELWSSKCDRELLKTIKGNGSITKKTTDEITNLMELLDSQIETTNKYSSNSIDRIQFVHYLIRLGLTSYENSSEKRTGK
jgi:hypothetical protein